jgi:hypothetical protein
MALANQKKAHIGEQGVVKNKFITDGITSISQSELLNEVGQ